MNRVIPIVSALVFSVGGCAGITSSTHLPPGEGYEVVFKTADAKLHIRSISIDGGIVCEPTAEGNGSPACSDTFNTRVSPGRHYLQIQVTKPGETGHDDAEERVAFEADGRYECTISERFVTVHKTAIDESGFPEPIVECRVVEVGEADASVEAPPAEAPPAEAAPAEVPPAEAPPAA